MAKLDKKKLGALVDKNSKKKPPPKKPGGGGGSPFGKHAKQEGQHEPGENAEHEQQEHANGGGDDDKKVDVQEIAEKVEHGDGEDQLMDLTAGYDPEQDGDPPDFVEDEDKWNKAKKLVEPHEDDMQNKWAVVAHVYKELGGTVKEEGGGGDGGEEHEDGANGGGGDE